MRKPTIVKFAIVYLPIIVGLVFSVAGMSYYLDASSAYPSPTLPKFGIINLLSGDFSPDDVMRVTIRNVSAQGKYVEVGVTLVLQAKEKQVKVFGLQVPGRVENAYAKIAYMDEEKTSTFYDQGEAVVEWKSESSVSIVTYEFQGQSGNPWYSAEIGFRWFNAVTRTGYSTYELMVPFSRVNNIADSSTGLIATQEKTSVMLTVYLPADTRLVDSIPKPSEEVIDWQNSGVGLRSLVFVDDVDFGMTPGWPNLPAFRVSFEVPEAQERYNRLVFDSGLFLGIGVQFLLAGVFDAIKLRGSK